MAWYKKAHYLKWSNWTIQCNFFWYSYVFITNIAGPDSIQRCHFTSKQNSICEIFLSPQWDFKMASHWNIPRFGSWCCCQFVAGSRSELVHQMIQKSCCHVKSHSFIPHLWMWSRSHWQTGTLLSLITPSETSKPGDRQNQWIYKWKCLCFQYAFQQQVTPMWQIKQHVSVY